MSDDSADERQLVRRPADDVAQRDGARLGGDAALVQQLDRLLRARLEHAADRQDVEGVRRAAARASRRPAPPARRPRVRRGDGRRVAQREREHRLRVVEHAAEGALARRMTRLGNCVSPTSRMPSFCGCSRYEMKSLLEASAWTRLVRSPGKLTSKETSTVALLARRQVDLLCVHRERRQALEEQRERQRRDVGEAERLRLRRQLQLDVALGVRVDELDALDRRLDQRVDKGRRDGRLVDGEGLAVPTCAEHWSTSSLTPAEGDMPHGEGARRARLHDHLVGRDREDRRRRRLRLVLALGPLLLGRRHRRSGWPT